MDGSGKPGTSSPSANPIPSPDPLSQADARDAFRVQRARTVARLMRRLGWVSLALGVFSLLGIAVLLLHGDLDLEQAFLAATGTALVSLLSGAGSYGSGMSLTLTASLLERNLRKSQPAPPHPPA